MLSWISDAQTCNYTMYGSICTRYTIHATYFVESWGAVRGNAVRPPHSTSNIISYPRHCYIFQPTVQSSRPRCLTNSLSKPFSQLHLRSLHVGQVEAMMEVTGTAGGEAEAEGEGPTPGGALSNKLCGQLRSALENG